MNLSKKLLLALLFLVLALGAFTVLAQDGRINVVHHFGGDVLYCELETGCWLVNMQGEPLWEVAQADIDAAFVIACETREAQLIQPDNGTYGPSTLAITCYQGYAKTLILSGWDEWGKPNSMEFGADYAPVYPAPSQIEAGTSKPSSPSLCEVYISNAGTNWEQTNTNPGWDVWEDGGDGIILDSSSAFLYFTETDPGLKKCIIGGGI